MQLKVQYEQLVRSYYRIENIVRVQYEQLVRSTTRVTFQRQQASRSDSETGITG